MKVTDKDFYLDGYLKANLDIAKKVIKKDWDMMFIVDGQEGSGKSTIASQMAYYCDNSLNLARMTFTPDEFQTAILKAKPYQSIVYDEAYSGLSSRATMSVINRTLVSMLAEIRQKNLFVFIVMPTFFDLDKYVALWRGRALIHSYVGEMFQRGFFTFYNYNTKKLLYVFGKKTYNYKPKITKTKTLEPNFRGRFSAFLPLDIKEYKKKKRLALNKRQNSELKKAVRKEIMDELLEHAFTLDGISVPDKCQILGIGQNKYFYSKREWKNRND